MNVFDIQVQVIEEVNRDGTPVNTAAGQKASADINSGPVTASFTADVPQLSAGFPTPGFGSFSTTAAAFALSAASAFPGPVNVFLPPQESAFGPVPQQGTVGFAGFAPSSQSQAVFGFAQSAQADFRQTVASGVVTTSASVIYTPLDQLSAEDRAQYEAAKFTLGRVPVRPPPKELV